jgi:translocation and assembly module TamB
VTDSRQNAESTELTTQTKGWRQLVRWSLRTLALIFLLLLLTLTAVSAALSTVGGSSWLLERITGYLNSDTQQFSIRSAEGTFLRGLNLQGVRWQSGDNQVAIAQLHSRWNPFTLMEGEFHLESLRITGMRITLGSSAESASAATPLMLDELLAPILPLPFALRLSNTRFDGTIIKTGEQEVSIDLLAFNASLQGSQLQVQQLEFGSDALTVQGTMRAELVNPYPLSARIRWRYDQILIDNTSAPAGELRLGGNLDKLTFQHSLRELASIESEGDIQLELGAYLNGQILNIQPRVDLQHVLQTQALPGLDNYRVEALRLQTLGTLQDLGMFAAARLHAELSPELSLTTDLSVRAYLRGTRLDVAEMTVQTDTGTLKIAGNVDWSQELNVALDFAIQDPEPLNSIPGLPDALMLSGLSSHGSATLTRLANDDIQLAFNLAELSATLNGFPLQGSATVGFDGARWQLDRLDLQNGDNRIEATATLNDDILNAMVSVDAPELQAFYSEISGRLHADALIEGRLTDPIINLNLTAEQLVYGSYQIPLLTVTGQNRGGMNELELNSGDITLGVAGNQETIERIMLRLRGQPDAHNMLLLANSSIGNLRINADGALTDEGWQGRLLSSELQSAYGQWRQQQSTTLALNENLIRVSDLCWIMLESRACLMAELRDNEQLQASVRIENIPLALLNDLQTQHSIAQDTGFVFSSDSSYDEIRLPFVLPIDVALAGNLNLDATLSGPVSNPQDMSIDVRVYGQPGSLFVRGEAFPDDGADGDFASLLPEPVINQFTWPLLELTAAQSNREWRLDGTLRFFQEDADLAAAMRGSADASLRMAADESLSGEIQINFDDLGWLEAMVPQIAMVSGELAGQLFLGGTRQAPIIGGDIMLSEAGFAVPALGLDLRGIEATISSDNSERFIMTGYLESGEGSLNFSGEAINLLAADREFSLRLAGSDFAIANLEDIRIAISPDLRFEGNLDGINMNGQLFIPLVDVRINTLPETAVDVSADTVIIAQPESRSAVRNAAVAETGLLGNIPLSGELTITLGNDVRVSGFGLTAQLRGELDITQRPGATPLTYGELEVIDGSFETYGRTLTIEQGKLLFMGSYDNPAIDIRAVREVDNMRVGVQMNGTIRNMRSSLFSTPTLADGDILAVMITGRPISEIGNQQDGNALIGAATSLGISQSQGIVNQIQNQLGLDAFAINSSGDVNDSSLMLGKYITPRIFVRYAVGLFETESSLAIDYTVNDRVKLQATSGQSQSIDITYTVEQ